MKLIIYMLFCISTITDSNCMIQQLCTEKGQCFVCGCEEDQSVFNISCKEDQMIQMEPFGNVMKDGDIDSDNCTLDNYDTCKETDSLSILNVQDRIEVYKNCTFKNSCEVNIKDRIKTGKNRLLIYPFYCRPRTSFQLISSKINQTQPKNPTFYFSGKNHTGRKIDCDCSANSSAPIRLDIFFIHLKPRTCSKVKFLSGTHQLFGCSTNDTTLFHIRYFYIGIDFKLEIRGMEPDVEDVLFFQVVGEQKLSVNCSGCINSPDPVTTEHPSQEGSVVSTDQADSGATIALGGILAAVIVINIVGIILYCFIRRRRKENKSRNTLTNVPGNGDQSPCNYIDITPDRPNYTNSTDSNVVQNDDQRNYSNANVLESIPMRMGSKDRPNNHVLEVDTYSEPANRRGDTGVKQNRGRKQDDYDHINDGSKSKPTINDTYNHIDSTVNTTSLSDDYNHIGDQNGLSTDKLELPGVAKKKKIISGEEPTSYVNANLETDESPSSTEDVDTYNHLQNSKLSHMGI